jgi:hypothetical protein
MAIRNRFSRLFGGDRPEPPRPGRAGESRTVGAPGRISGGSADYERSTDAPPYVGPTGGPWSYVPNHRELTVQPVTVAREADWGLPPGSQPIEGSDVKIHSSTSNPSRPRTKAMGYNYETGILQITFRDGKTYAYENVTPSEWSEISHSWSPGRWMNDNYLDGHEFYRVS